MSEREEFRERLAAAIDETLYAFAHSLMSAEVAKESILAAVEQAVEEALSRDAEGFPSWYLSISERRRWDGTAE